MTKRVDGSMGSILGDSQPTTVSPYPVQRTFTTERKVKRLIWHKQNTVKTRATALQESFYPTPDVPYAAVTQRMATLLGIVDRASILAYLGRPKTIVKNELDQLVIYRSSGKKLLKTHDFKRVLPAKAGYIERFNLGYCYEQNGECWIHWFHSEQISLNSHQSEGLEQNRSIDNFSLPYRPKETVENTETIDKRERESDSKGERNSESESNRVTQPLLTLLEQAILRAAKNGGEG